MFWKRVQCLFTGHEWRVAYWTIRKERICLSCGKTKPFTGKDF